eukprot:10914371-Alexandrium_andersonii.AAC.1
MSASLVGSEMCIRDSLLRPPEHSARRELCQPRGRLCDREPGALPSSRTPRELLPLLPPGDGPAISPPGRPR